MERIKIDTFVKRVDARSEKINRNATLTALAVSNRNICCWRSSGLVPYFKLGKAVRFRVADVAAALERMRVG